MQEETSKWRLGIVSAILGLILGLSFVSYFNAHAGAASTVKPVEQITTVTETVTVTETLAPTATQVFGDDAIQIELDYQFIGNATTKLNITELILYIANPEDNPVPTHQFYEIRADEITLKVKVLVNDVDAIIAAIKGFLEQSP